MVFKRTFNALLCKLTGYELQKKPPPLVNETVVTLEPEGNSKGRVLLAYFTEPFLLPGDSRILKSHAHFEESHLIAETFLEMGYTVDVIDYRNHKFIPNQSYAFLVSARTHFEIFSDRLNKDCIKISHLETAHWLFNNSAVYRRCINLLKRRNIALGSRSKQIEYNWAIENSDFAVVLGNSFTKSTYEYANKSIFTINNFSVVQFDRPDNKDFDKVRNIYIWLGSDGMIHKGLDLVLEAFFELPDHELIVCGPVDKDRMFAKAYRKELYETKNIITKGWIDVSSQEFKDICKNAVGMVYPSASEGQAGSVVTCMHAGLIPIISYETGVDLQDNGVILKECTVGTIKDEITKVSGYPADRLRDMAMKTWELATTVHSREYYREKYKAIIEEIMKIKSREAINISYPEVN